MASPQKEINLIEINLLPLEFRHTRVNLSWLFDARVMWSTFALILVGLFLSFSFFYVAETTDGLKKAVEQTRQAIEKERPLLDKIAELEEKQRVIKEKSDALLSIQVSRKRWVILFEDLSSALPYGTWITGIVQNAEIMDINCATWNFSEVALYMLKLEQKESVTNVSLTNISAAKVNGEDAYDFSLKVGFNPSLGLETGIR
jgi:type IV pilus assembly protein PilN